MEYPRDSKLGRTDCMAPMKSSILRGRVLLVIVSSSIEIFDLLSLVFVMVSVVLCFLSCATSSRMGAG